MVAAGAAGAAVVAAAAAVVGAVVDFEFELEPQAASEPAMARARAEWSNLRFIMVRGTAAVAGGIAFPADLGRFGHRLSIGTGSSRPAGSKPKTRP